MDMSLAPDSPAASPSPPFRLSPLAQAFVLHFGEMGSRWGINRTVGQIYALLFIAPEALHADEIAETLGISRSNVSMGLKELMSWELVKLQHRPGERKEFYSAPGDVWDIAKTLIEQRRKREIDPTLSTLRNLLIEKPANADEIFAVPHVDGALVGGASLKAADFGAIVAALAKA